MVISVDVNGLRIKKCNIGYSWNVNNCRCEMKKLAAHSYVMLKLRRSKMFLNVKHSLKIKK